MTPRGILATYRVVYSVLIIVASVQTVVDTPTHHLILLASAEVLGALVLLWRQVQWLGAALLLIVFTCAQVISAAEGDYPMRFALYAASAVLIVLMDRVLARKLEA